MMRRILIVLIALMMMPMVAFVRAEVSADIIEVMKKSDAVVSRPEGIRMEMDVKAKFIVTINMHITNLSKGEKSRMMMQTSVLGKTLYSEEGCDGVQGWSYELNDLSKNKRDTLTIYPATNLESDYSVEMDTYDDYQNAKMKLKDGVYEIALSKPKTDDVPTKTIMLIDAETYYPKEIQMKQSGATITIKINEITFGVADKDLNFDIANYPGAVVVRRN